MYHRDVIAKIARRLPHCTQREVAKVIEVLTEVWSEELINGKEIIVPDVGRLSMYRSAGHTSWRSIRKAWTTTPSLWAFSSDTEFEETDSGGGI